MGVIMGAKKIKVLFRGLIEIYLSCYFAVLILQRRNKQLKTVVSMLSCGALERSSNSYIDPIVEPCVSKNQK